MSSAAADGAITVLIAGDDPFEGRYIRAVLERHDLRVAGAFATLPAALHAIAATPPAAAILALHRAPDLCLALSLELRRIGVPHLHLSRTAFRPAALRATPVLTAPFGGFQVAEWVLNAIGGPASMAPVRQDREPAAIIDADYVKKQ